MKKQYLSLLIFASLSCAANNEAFTSQFEGYIEGQKTSSTPIQFAAIGSGFNYQGELLDSGTAVNVNFDFSFKLFDALIGGNQVGSNIIKGNRTVNGGIFSIEDIDFGDAAYSGDELWLSVTVRETGNPGSETTLSPRQKINAVPYAVQADYLGPLGASNGDFLKFNAGEWAPSSVAPGSSPWITSGNNVSYTAGDVSIGTNVSGPSLVVQANSGTVLLARAGSASKFVVAGNGGVGVGSGFNPPTDGLRVRGRTLLKDTTDAGLADNTGVLVVGDEAGINIVMDGNEIMARNNGVSSQLLLQHEAGVVRINQNAAVADATLAGGGALVIGSSTLPNLVFDNNEILARDNGVASTLFVGASGSTGTSINATTGKGLLAIGAGSSQIQIDGDDIQRKSNDTTGTLFLNFYGGNISIGSSGATTTINGTLSTPSDIRLKEDIIDLPYGLAEIMMLKPKAYNWIGVDSVNKSFGLIAQDVRDVMQELVHELDSNRKEKDVKSLDKTLSLSYTEMIPVLINAVQEQQAIIDDQDKKINQLIIMMENMNK